MTSSASVNAPIPPPPPPPPPPPALPHWNRDSSTDPTIVDSTNGTHGTMAVESLSSHCPTALRKATQILELARCQEAELEAAHVWTASLLLRRPQAVPRHHHQRTGNTVPLNHLPGGVQDAWVALSEATTTTTTNTPMSSGTNDSTAATPTVPSAHTTHALTALLLEHARDGKDLTVPMGTGQWTKAVQTQVLTNTLRHSATLASSITAERATEAAVLKAAVTTAKQSSCNVWLDALDARLSEIQAYHARHDATMEPPAHKRPRMGNPVSDGYDLVGTVVQPSLRPLQDETLFAAEEVLGRYLDLLSLYSYVTATPALQHIFAGTDTSNDRTSASSFLYVDFLTKLSAGLELLPEAAKLHARKHYVRTLQALQDYLEGFLQRTTPLLNLIDVTGPAILAFEQEWQATGGYAPGWEAKPFETGLVSIPAPASSSLPATNDTESPKVDLTRYASAEELAQDLDGDRLKVELSRLGLKCGGSVAERAARLFVTRDTPWDQLPKKMFAKQSTKIVPAVSSATTTTATGAKNERRVDLARREVLVTALLDQLRVTLEATIRRTERRQTQTLNEREKELEQEWYGAEVSLAPKKKTDDSDDEEDDDDAPIYNPKNVPLDWDGKPIPYWLFKLHGLNHYYECEICGGESYRGRRNFELHFADQKHALGMKSLGIPNTKHFHGVTKIDDARDLWKSLQGKLEKEQFDGSREEEYEDSHGNVMSRKTYEDLGRQGLL